ncbi:sugar phosphate isomerase/epimerase family protein [Roseomonas elaeocarpi]|uniref:Sugar phosphate isomerase/epimerase family protein n=1 Tax=Roseomonas elaeocarpi TaxID=907779 RepID=A0ABV6JNS7_9PROT
MTGSTPRQQLFLNTVILGGSAEGKLRAAHEAGFDAVELWDRDVTGELGGPAGARGVLRGLGMQVTDYQVLLNFDGTTQRAAKRAEALELLERMAEVGAPMLVVSASFDEHAGGSLARIAEDLDWIAAAAGQRELRVAYEPMAWSRWVSTLPEAAALLARVNRPNLGLVVDSFHLLLRDRPVEEVAAIPAERIFLVQLADSALRPGERDLTAEAYMQQGRHARLLPGEGCLPVRALAEVLRGGGYAGPVGIEVFNDRLSAADPAVVARDAMASLRRLGF